MDADKYVDLLLNVLRTDTTAFKQICTHTGGSHVVQSLLGLMPPSKMIELTNILVGKDGTKNGNPKTSLIKDLFLDVGAGFFVMEKLLNEIDGEECEDIIEVLIRDEKFNSYARTPKNGTRFINLMTKICSKIGKTFLNTYKDILGPFFEKKIRVKNSFDS